MQSRVTMVDCGNGNWNYIKNYYNSFFDKKKTEILNFTTIKFTNISRH